MNLENAFITTKDGRELATLTGEDALMYGRLFTAAPELLAACERILRAIEWSEPADRMTKTEQADLLRAAIAKAKAP